MANSRLDHECAVLLPMLHILTKWMYYLPADEHISPETETFGQRVNYRLKCFN